METLRISLFGTFRISHANFSSEINITPKGQALLAYLLLQGRRLCPRERLAELLWRDRTPSRARSCLRTTLWRLRQALEPGEVSPGTYLITSASDEIGFNWESDFWLDVLAFEQQASQLQLRTAPALQATDVQTLEETLLLYEGDFLEGFYEDWIITEQERLRALYLNCLEYLMRHYRQCGLYEQGLAYGQKILACEPVHEEIHREIMQIYLAMGQRALAIQQYETCCRILDRELEIGPMTETQDLYEQILAGAENTPSQRMIRVNQVNLQEALEQLSLATHHLEAAQHQLNQANATFKQAQHQVQQALRLVERAKKH